MEFEVFYDGDCPLCKREIDLLRYFDRKKRILFTDIAAENFRPESLGLSMETLMDRIHGRDARGNMVEGVEVFRRLYMALGLGWLVKPTRLPIISHALDGAYRIFARNRLRLTGRCNDGSCQITSQA